MPFINTDRSITAMTVYFAVHANHSAEEIVGAFDGIESIDEVAALYEEATNSLGEGCDDKLFLAARGSARTLNLNVEGLGL